MSAKRCLVLLLAVAAVACLWCVNEVCEEEFYATTDFANMKIERVEPFMGYNAIPHERKLARARLNLPPMAMPGEYMPWYIPTKSEVKP